MSSKIIVDNRTDESDEDVLRRVLVAMAPGRVSTTAGKAHYCHVTTWRDGIVVYGMVNKKSDRFVVMKDETR